LNVDNTYTAQARVLYQYGTSALGTLRLVSYDYLRSLPAAQQANVQNQAGFVKQSSTSAPITISFSAGKRPLLVRSGATNSFILQIILTNTGSGEPFDVGASYSGGTLNVDDLRKVNVDITTDLSGFTCPTLGGTSGQVKLGRSESKSIYCQFSPTSGDVLNTKDYTVTVNLRYGYYSDSSTTINVQRVASIV